MAVDWQIPAGWQIGKYLQTQLEQWDGSMQVSPSLTIPLGQKQPGKQTPLWKGKGSVGGWGLGTCKGGQED